MVLQDGEEEILNWQSEVETVQGRTEPSHGLVYDRVEVGGAGVLFNYTLTSRAAQVVVASCSGIVIAPVAHCFEELFLSFFPIMYRDQQGIQVGPFSVELGDLVHSK